MSTAYWIVGDARSTMAALPAGSVDVMVTSPPFLALRDYLHADDPAKVHEIGSEANPGEFVDTLLDITEAVARLLAPHGSLCVELGDTYSGASASGTDDRGNDRYPKGRTFTTGKRDRSCYWPMDKSLALVPETYRWALAYGRNPHNGRTTDPWRIRNVIRWVRPNPPVGALGDKFRPATSEMVVACKAKDRWFDLDAVHTTPVTNLPPANGNNTKGSDDNSHRFAERINSNPAGAPPLDWWQISPGGYSGAHYAVFPPELCIRPIEAMCPRRVCRTCGTPSRRIVDRERRFDADDSTRNKTGGPLARSQDRPPRTTIGWSTCGCPGTDGTRLDGYHTGSGWRPGIVLDPFAGSGTTAAVATGHSRDCISIDLDIRNLHLARDRIGMWLVETTATDFAREVA